MCCCFAGGRIPMNDEETRGRLYEKYIVPTKKKKNRFAGIEVEMPILNLNKEAVVFDRVHETARSFTEHFGFEPSGFDEEGNFYLAEDDKTGDSLSFDCSYNNLELSLGKVRDLNEAEKRFRTYYSYIQSEFGRSSYTLTGMGVNPYRYYNHNVPIHNGRYRMLFHHLHSYPKYRNLPMLFHPYPAYGTFSSASQVQLDVTEQELLPTLRAFSRLEPIKALLFSNSVLLGEMEDLLCARDMFWENSTHGINPHNVGMYEVDFYSEKELLDYIQSTSIYCTERGDKYINFAPTPILEYFRKESVSGEYYDLEAGEYRTIDIVPEPDDLAYLRTFKFEDLTWRGTIEFRSCCCQPIRDVMTVSAFHIGLQKKLVELDALLEEDTVLYHHGYTASELRKLFVREDIPPYVDKERLYLLTREILDLSKKGLNERGFSEEHMLDPLYERLERRTNPAKDMLRLIHEENTTLEQVIDLYS